MKKNFLPFEFNKGVLKEFSWLASIINIIFLLVFSGLFIHSFIQEGKTQDEIDAKQKIVESKMQENLIKKTSIEENPFYLEVTERMDTKTKNITFKFKDTQLNKFYNHVNDSLTTDMKLSYVAFLSENEILIQGQAVNYSDIHEYYTTLMGTVFKTAEITDILVFPKGETGNFALREVVYFEIKGVAKDE